MDNMGRELDFTPADEQRLLDYVNLYRLAYETEPSMYQLDGFSRRDTESQLITLRLLADATTDTIWLQLQCLGLGTPEWMMAGAPDPSTHQRWYEAGRLY
jgi:hypothetical protein